MFGFKILMNSRVYQITALRILSTQAPQKILHDSTMTQPNLTIGDAKMDEKLLMGQKSKETRWYIWTMIAIIRDSQFSISTINSYSWKMKDFWNHWCRSPGPWVFVWIHPPRLGGNTGFLHFLTLKIALLENCGTQGLKDKRHCDTKNATGCFFASFISASWPVVVVLEAIPLSAHDSWRIFRREFGWWRERTPSPPLSTKSCHVAPSETILVKFSGSQMSLQQIETTHI